MEKFYLAGERLSGLNDFSRFRVEPSDLEKRAFQRVVRSCSISIKPGMLFYDQHTVRVRPCNIDSCPFI